MVQAPFCSSDMALHHSTEWSLIGCRHLSHTSIVQRRRLMCTVSLCVCEGDAGFFVLSLWSPWNDKSLELYKILQAIILYRHAEWIELEKDPARILIFAFIVCDPLWKNWPLSLKYDFAVGGSILDSTFIFGFFFFRYSESMVLRLSSHKISMRYKVVLCLYGSGERMAFTFS